MIDKKDKQSIEKLINKKLTSVKRLKGGMTSNVFAVKTVDGEYIVRLYNRIELDEVEEMIEQESFALKAVGECSRLTPKFIASNTESSVPMLIMTKVDGEVVLEPDDVEKWVDGLAQALVKIHSYPIENDTYTYFTYQNYKQFTAPTWSAYQEEWKRAIQYLQQGQPKAKQIFIHRDYHPNNVLWQNGRVSGVVDWVNACRGPAQIDIGHCRVNLVQLYNQEIADLFLEKYIEYTKEPFMYEPHWDLITLTDILFEPVEVYEGWIDLGLINLTNKLIKEKLDEYFHCIIRKLSREVKPLFNIIIDEVDKKL